MHSRIRRRATFARVPARTRELGDRLRRRSLSTPTLRSHCRLPCSTYPLLSSLFCCSLPPPTGRNGAARRRETIRRTARTSPPNGTSENSTRSRAAGRPTRPRTSAGLPGSARPATARRWWPTAASSAPPTTAPAGSSNTRPRSISAACSVSGRATAGSSGNSPARSSLGSSTIPTRASAARRWSRGNGSGSSRTAARSSASRPMAPRPIRTSPTSSGVST